MEEGEEIDEDEVEQDEPPEEDEESKKTDTINNLKSNDEHEPTPEDLAFEQEFEKMMKETLQQSGKSHLAGSAVSGDNLVVPLNIVKKSTTNTKNGRCRNITIIKTRTKSKS